MGIYGILLFFLISLNLVAQAAKKNGNEEDVNAATKPQPKPIQFPNPVVLDISNVSNHFVHNQATSAELTTFTTSPAQGNNVVEVKDGSSSIWKGDGCTEKCFSVTRHVKDGLDIIDLNIFAKSGTCSHKYFEKSGQEWKDIEKEVYDEKRPKSDTYTLQSGIEFEAKVEYKPVDNPREANQATEGAESTPQDASKNATASAPGTTQQAGQPADQPGATPQNAQVGGPSQAPQPTGQPVTQTDTSQPTAPETTDVPNPPSGVPKPEVSADTASPPDTNSVEAAAKVTESSTGADGGNTSADADPASSSDGGTPSHSTSTVGATSFDISNVDDNVVELTESEEEDGMKKRVYRMRDMSKVTLVTDGGFQFYKGDTEVKAVVSFSKDNHTFLFVQYKKMVENQWMCHFECSDGTWNPLTQEEYNTKFKQMKGLESLKHTENPYTFKTNPLPKKDESQKSQNASGQEQAKQKLEIEGIDSETFVLNKSDEGGVSVISCSSKIGKNPSSFNYKEEVVWSTTDTSFYLSKALLYYDGEVPTLARLKTKNKMNDEGTVYKYKDEKGEWKDVASETDFDKKLKELKKAKGGSQSSESGEHSENDESASDQSATEGTRSGALSGGSQTRTTSQEDLTTITLNIKNPDEKTIEKHNLRLHDLKTPSYTAKDGYHIEKIMDGNVEICNDFPTGAFIKVTHCYRETWFALLHVYIVESDDKKSSQYFLKKDGQWNEVREEVFYDHFNALSHTEHDFYEETFFMDEKRDPWRLYINESIKSPFVVYGPKTTCRVIEIKTLTRRRLGTTIWKRKKDEWCTKITLYPKKDYKLMWIVTKDPYEKEEILYYSKASGSWKSVDKDAYLVDLEKAGFKESEFNDRVTLDIARPDKLLFFEDKYNVDIVTMNRYHVFPGFRISKVMDGMSVIWESTEDKFATYFRLNTRGSKVSLGALFTTNTRREHEIIYYAKDASGSWKVIQKSLYYDILAGRGSPLYTKEAPKPTIVMSSFRNKQGFKVLSYAFTVEDAKANIILVHGIRGSILTDYGTFDMDWSYERYGFDTFPHISIFDKPVEVNKSSNADRYRQYFEYVRLEGMNPYDIIHRSQYEGSFLEALNRLGYNIYGYDNQSHGFSEAKTERRCHADGYEDYARDVMQFVSIIRRGKFEDSNEAWDESTVFASHNTDRKTFLFGYSIGGNMVVRALEAFYEKLEDPNAKFVDGAMFSSCMLDIEFYLDIWYKKFVRWTLSKVTWAFGSRNCPFQYPYDISVDFERFADYHTDMLYYNRIPSITTLAGNFDTCRDARDEKKTKFIPNTLPLFFAHTTDDDVCDVKGPRSMVNERLNNNKAVTYVELSGSGHHSVATQLVPILIPQLNDWLNARFPELKGRDIGVRLDVSSVDDNVFETRDSTEGEVPLRKVSTKGGYRLTEISDGQESLWKTYGSNQYCQSVWLYYDTTGKPILATVRFIKSDGITDVKYCDKLRGKWTQVTKEDYETALTSMKRNVILAKLNVKLDVTSVDFSAFTVQDSTDGDIVTKTFAPKKRYRLTEVSDGEEAIWKAYSSKQYCLSILTHCDAAEKPILATITYVKDDGKTTSRCYMKQDNGTWKWVEKVDFDASLAKIKKDLILSKIRAKLDISSVDKSMFTISDSTDDVFLQHTLTPKSDYRLTEVSDGTLSIWKADNDNEYGTSVWVYYDGNSPILITIYYVKDDDTNAVGYYLKDDGTWEWVNKNVRDKTLEELRNMDPSLLKLRIRLDVANVDGTMFTIQESTDENLPTKILSPKAGYRLTVVSDGPNIIWRAYGYKEHCKSAWFYYDTAGLPMLATVHFVKDDGKNVLRRYMKQDDGTWRWTKKADHDEKLTSMKKDATLSKQSVKLDVADVDKDVFTIKESSDGGIILLKTLTPMDNHRLTEVSHAQESLWKAYGNKEYCLSTLVYYDPDEPILATVNYAKDDGMSAVRYYTKVDDGTWEWVNKEVHDEKLEGLKKKAHDKVLEELKDVSLPVVKDRLDLTNIYGTLFDIKYYFNGRVPMRHITPKTGHLITAVSDGPASIWSAYDEGEHCLSVLVHCDVDIPVLATVHFAKSSGNTACRCYLKQDDGTWEWVNKSVHDERLEELKREPPESPQNDAPEEVLQEEDLQVTQKELRDVEVDEEVIQEEDLEDTSSPEVTTSPTPPSGQLVLLDITSPDTTKIDVKGGQAGGFKHYYPKDGFTISHVIDNDKVFWKLVEGEKCDLVQSNEKNGSIFLSITITKDGVPILKCFMKVGSTWTELTESEYYQKLSEQSSQPSSRSPSLKGSTESLASSSTSLNA